MSNLDGRVIAERLRSDVSEAAPLLLALSSAAAKRRPAPGKWSPQEILGHLIDSASNNHQRFVRARFQDDLVFPGYAQDDWVAAQGWQERPWSEIVELWRLYNLHLAHLIESTPAALAARRVARHNLHERAWRAIGASEPATLAWFQEDYVLHLEHHLAQVRLR